MFLIRQVTVDDASTLLKLAKMVHFINLPADPDIIRTKIVRSRRSFAGDAANEREREFVFVIQDTETGNVVGTASIVATVSWPGHPHTFFQVRKREHYSDDLQTGQVHTTLEFGTDETGPSEIGGLILGPSYRGHKDKLGMQLSLVRFHFIGLNRRWFADRILAEMMGPLTPDSQNLLWEYLGRRFINLSFTEADRFCQRSKEFITSLFPRGEIYLSLLPPEARNLVGRVGSETEPAKRLLERIGFSYEGRIDPFDAGPYLEANVDDISLVNTTKSVTLKGTGTKFSSVGFVSTHGAAGFRAMRCGFDESADGVSIPAEVADLLGAKPGDSIGLTPLPSSKPKTPDNKSADERAASSSSPEAVR